MTKNDVSGGIKKVEWDRIARDFCIVSGALMGLFVGLLIGGEMGFLIGVGIFVTIAVLSTVRYFRS